MASMAGKAKVLSYPTCRAETIEARTADLKAYLPTSKAITGARAWRSASISEPSLLDSYRCVNAIADFRPRSGKPAADFKPVMTLAGYGPRQRNRALHAAQACHPDRLRRRLGVGADPLRDKPGAVSQPLEACRRAAAAAAGTVAKAEIRPSQPSSPRPRCCSAARCVSRRTAGHFIADFKLNGRSVGAMVDTGATLVAINLVDRAPHRHRSRRGFQIHGRTANGETRAAGVDHRQAADRPHPGRERRAVVLDDKALDGTLIGMSFLNRLGEIPGRERRAAAGAVSWRLTGLSRVSPVRKWLGGEPMTRLKARLNDASDS